MVLKSINNFSSMYLCNSFTKNSSRDIHPGIITLRNSDSDLFVPSMTTKNGQQSFP